jgi:hypothetical protein
MKPVTAMAALASHDWTGYTEQINRNGAVLLFSL